MNRALLKVYGDVVDCYDRAAPILEPPAALPYVAVVFDDPDVYFKVKKDLISALGKIDYETPAFDTEGLPSLYDTITRRRLRASAAASGRQSRSRRIWACKFRGGLLNTRFISGS